MGEARVGTAIDWEIHDRLRGGDESALGDLLARFGRAVRHRLRTQFGDSLNEDDLDDVLQAAVFRLWTYRLQYDPAKGSIGYWFYLVARSGAFDLLRRTREPTLPTSEWWHQSPGGSPIKKRCPRIGARRSNECSRRDAAVGLGSPDRDGFCRGRRCEALGPGLVARIGDAAGHHSLAKIPRNDAAACAARRPEYPHSP